VAGRVVALSGFPFGRQVRDCFTSLVDQTRWRDADAGVRLLCIHQVVEGARVGPHGYTFRSGADIVRGRDIPAAFDAILAGHIHRAQVLSRDLGGRQLAAPVIYPGSVERTAFAERNEPKGYMLVRIETALQDRRASVRTEFVPLPARPMVVLCLEPGVDGLPALAEQVRSRLAAMDPNSVVRVEVRGSLAAPARAVLGASALRDLAPRSMNVELAPGS
jgi:DNA repair exonuclease SbcCD nuclease subunit